MIKQEVVKNFLNLPGVEGVALTQGQGQPYLYIKDQTWNWQQKQALMQKILETLATVPLESAFSEFQVMDYYVYTYLLTHDLKLLVLTHGDLVAIKFLAAKQLKNQLQEDINQVIPIFQDLTRKLPQSEFKATEVKLDKQEVKKPLDEQLSSSKITATAATSKPLQQIKNPSVAHSLEVKITIEELLIVLNHLSQCSNQYLGKTLTANYWHSSRPDFEWLNKFETDHTAKITFSGLLTEPINPLQLQWFLKWINAFIKCCSQIIQDFPNMIDQKQLDKLQTACSLSNRADTDQSDIKPG
jgi:hypothetical protein